MQRLNLYGVWQTVSVSMMFITESGATGVGNAWGHGRLRKSSQDILALIRHSCSQYSLKSPRRRCSATKSTPKRISAINLSAIERILFDVMGKVFKSFTILKASFGANKTPKLNWTMLWKRIVWHCEALRVCRPFPVRSTWRYLGMAGWYRPGADETTGISPICCHPPHAINWFVYCGNVNISMPLIEGISK